MHATFSAHLVLDTNNGVFRLPAHWLLVSRNFRRKFVVKCSTGRIVYGVSSFQSYTLTDCRKVCPHLHSNVASYNKKIYFIYTSVKT